MNVQIACKNVALGYEGSIVAEKLSFEVAPGDHLYILGENGSGKSTLVKALLGLKPQLSGEILRGEGVAPGQIGYLPQQPLVQRDFPASVREIVLSGCLSKSGLRPFYNAAERERAAAAMERLGITELSKRCYRELSGGQQQRVLLARALCAAGKILLLDEPVTGLDPRAQADLYEMIGSLNRDGVTIIMVSHDVGAAMRHASHILHIGSRRQLFFGTAEDYAKSAVGRTFIASEEAENDD
ncbi:MAG: ATP-binding cassette domain-containing protein [Ruminococcus sp.]|nr:ATP-binding cassette domain-containing protein [Ruminococcus sp.]